MIGLFCFQLSCHVNWQGPLLCLSLTIGRSCSSFFCRLTGANKEDNKAKGLTRRRHFTSIRGWRLELNKNWGWATPCALTLLDELPGSLLTALLGDTLSILGWDIRKGLLAGFLFLPFCDYLSCLPSCTG